MARRSHTGSKPIDAPRDIRSLEEVDDPARRIRSGEWLRYFVKGFGQDQKGEVYVMASKVLGPSGTTGTVFKIVPPDGAGIGASDTGVSGLTLN